MPLNRSSFHGSQRSAIDGDALFLAFDPSASNDDVFVIAKDDLARAMQGGAAVPLPITDYGATITGDNVPAIVEATLAAQAAQASGGRTVVVIPRSPIGYWPIYSPVEILDVDVVMDAPLRYMPVGIQSAPALTVGSIAGVGNYAEDRRYRLSVQRHVRDWSDEANIGICLRNLHSSYIDIVETNAFTIGVQALSDGQGFAYNTTHLNRLFDCCCGLELRSDNVGWVNENLWIAGKFSNGSTTLTATARTGVRITTDGTYPYNNNNVFIKPSFELAGSDNGLPIDMVGGMINTFWAMRSEGNRSDAACVVRGESQNNVIDFGFIGDVSSTAVLELGQYSSTITTRAGEAQLSRHGHVTATAIGPLHQSAYDTDGAGGVGVAGMSVMASSAATKYLGLTGLTIASDHVEIVGSRALGFFVDTSTVKTWRFLTQTKAGFGGRVLVQCFNAAGTVLTDADAGHPYVKGSSANTTTWTSSWGGAYTTGVDLGDLSFTLGADVASIFIAISRGTANCKVSSCTLQAIDPGPTSTWLHTARAHGQFAKYATAAPTVGTYEDGEVIWNAAPSAGGTPGWVCTTPGTPGTWKAMANLAA